MKPLMPCCHPVGSEGRGNPACMACAEQTRAVHAKGGEPQLAGRKARCGSCGATVPSNTAGLAFFEYRGSGSRFARISCAKCGQPYGVHASCGCTLPEGRIVDDHDFVAGDNPAEFDAYYCGCRGWN